MSLGPPDDAPTPHAFFSSTAMEASVCRGAPLQRTGLRIQPVVVVKFTFCTVRLRCFSKQRSTQRRRCRDGAGRLTRSSAVCEDDGEGEARARVGRARARARARVSARARARASMAGVRRMRRLGAVFPGTYASSVSQSGSMAVTSRMKTLDVSTAAQKDQPAQPHRPLVRLARPLKRHPHPKRMPTFVVDHPRRQRKNFEENRGRVHKDRDSVAHGPVRGAVNIQPGRLRKVARDKAPPHGGVVETARDQRHVEPASSRVWGARTRRDGSAALLFPPSRCLARCWAHAYRCR